MRHARLCAAATALAVLAPIAARAQPAVTPAAPTAPAADKRARAKALVDAGLAAHDRGDYDQAIARYAEAYALVPHPALFFNMGQSHRKAGRPDAAIAMYRRYLAEVTTGALADQARAWIATLEASRGGDAAPPAPGLTAPIAIAPTTATAASAEPAPPRAGNRDLRLAGYGAGAAGAIAIGAGALFGLHARTLSDQLSQPGAPFEPDRYAAGRTAEHRMIACYGVGGALLVGGAVLYLLGRGPDRDDLTPIVDGSHVGLSWSGRF